MFVITNRQDIENAQQEFESKLKEHCDMQIPVKLGYKGGYEACSIYWCRDFGIWFYSKTIEGSRYWNAFGLSEDAPRINSMLDIICEINPPIQGLNKRVQGVFMQNNEGLILLAHRGRIGGGKPGIGRELFFNNYQGDIREIDGERLAMIGVVTSPDFVRRISNFVREVKHIKGLVP